MPKAGRATVVGYSEFVVASEAMRKQGLAQIDGGAPPPAGGATADLPLVSVVIRTGYRPELREALESVATQTYPNLEAVVVDSVGEGRPAPEFDGDLTVILASLGEPLDRCRAANVGVDAGRGDFVLMLDDDDLLLPDHVARLVAALAEVPGARVAHAGVRVEGEGGRLIDLYDADFPPAKLFAWNHLPMNAVLFDRALAREACRFDEDLEVYEDWDFWLQLSRHTPFARAPGVSAIYRAHLGQSKLTVGDPETVRTLRNRVWEKWLRRMAPEDMEALVEDFRRQAAEAAGRLDDAHHAIGELEHGHTVTLERLAEIHARHAALERRHEEALGDAAAVLANTRAEAQGIAQGLRADLEATRTALEATRGSMSWRITRPLRSLMGLMGRR